jgi:beta-lactamase superfamily II metal-dependent hydrolase
MHKADIQKERLLEIVWVDVGQGDGALLVTPDDTKYVIDAGVGDNMRRYLAWRFDDFKKLLKDFDGLLISHPDKDHYLGFQQLVDHLDVQADNIWHNGIVEQFKISTAGSQSSDAQFLLGPRKTSAGQSFLTGLIEDDASL